LNASQALAVIESGRGDDARRRVYKLARYVYCDRETTVLRQRDSRCCSASIRSCGRGATGLRSAGSMTNRFLSFAQPHGAAVQGERLLTPLTPKRKRRIARRASLLSAPSCRFRVGLAAALLRGRRRHAVAVVLDLRGVGLSPFSIMVVRQARLRARAGRRSPLGHYDAPSSVDLLSEPTSSMTPHAEPPSRIASEQLAQFFLRRLERPFPLRGKVSAGSIHVKGQHRHR
jgi:hypothetical protein